MKTYKDIDKLWHDIKKYEDALKRKQEELTELIDKLKPKQCDIPIVMQQRELLIGFAEVYQSCHLDDTVENTVDWYLRVKDN